MSKLFRQMSVYGIGGLLTKFIQFLLLPLYTRVFAPSEYGILEIVYLVGNFLAIIFGLMIRSGYVRYYYTFSKELEKRTLFNSALWFIIISSIFFLFLLEFLINRIELEIFQFSDQGLLIRLIAISTILTTVNQLFYGDLQVREEANRYILINLLGLLVTLSLTIYIVVFLKLSVAGVLMARIIGGIFELIWLALLTVKLPVLSYSFPLLTTMLTYSIPLIPVQLAFFVLELSDRFFLKNYVDLREVGLYALAYRLSSVLLLLAIEPLRAFTPYIFSLVDNPVKCKQTLADFARYYIFAISVIVLVLSMFAPEVISLVASESYQESWRAIYLITLSYAIYGLAVLSSYAIEIVKMNWISAIFWSIAAICNILLNIFLIPYYGMLGAALATAISYLLVLIGYWIATRIFYAVPYQYSKIFYIFVVMTIIYLLSTTIHTNLLLSVILKSGLITLFIIVVLAGGYITKGEINIGKNFVMINRTI